MSNEGHEDGGVAVLEETVPEEPIVRPKPRRTTEDKSKTKRQPPYAVIVHNDEDHTFQFVIGLALAKLISTTVTIGSGTVGGVMTPTLLLGAAAGSVLGGSVHALGWNTELPTGAFALVGMGAMTAATTHRSRSECHRCPGPP